MIDPFLQVFFPEQLFPSAPRIHGGGDGSAGLVALVDDLLEKATRLLDSGGSPSFMPGIQALGANVHPMLVHFPIAFLTAFLLLDLAGLLRKRPALRLVASWMLYLGAVGAILAAAAGLIAEDLVPHGEAVHDIMEWHGRIGLTVASLATGLAIWRAVARNIESAMANTLHLSLAAIIVVSLAIGTDLGGLMVYHYGVGVQSLQIADEHHHRPDAAAD